MRPNPMIERKLRKVRSHPPVAVYPLVGLDDPAATAITPEMFHPSQIGIYRSCEFRRLLFSATSAIDIEHLPETADHTMARIDPSGLDIAADEQYAPVGALQVNFTGMKRQMQLLAQKIADHGNQRFQITGILVHDIKIIHITAVMTHFQLPFHPLVEAIHVDIAEQLRSQIADGKTAVGRSVKRLLLGGKSAHTFRDPRTMQFCVASWKITRSSR